MRAPLALEWGPQEARLWPFENWSLETGPEAAAPELRRIWPLLSQLGEGCGSSGRLMLAGPWAQPQARLWAALLWREGEAEACLALLRETSSSVEVAARSRISAGFSSRYNEYFEPRLEPVLLRLPEQRLLLKVVIPSMGHGGGGGDSTNLYLAEEGGFRQVLEITLNGATNINTAMIADSSSCRGALEFHHWRQEAWLEARTCFDDGEPALTWYRFDGRRFMPQEQGSPGLRPSLDAGVP